MLSRWRHEALCLNIATFKKKFFHLLFEVFSRARVGEIQPIFIDEPSLDGFPFFPSLLRDALPDFYAHLARVRWVLKAWGLFVEFETLNGTTHGNILQEKVE